MKKPKSNFNNFIIQELSDEILIYNLSTNKASSLNKTAAFVWNKCDGNTSIDELTLAFNQHFPAKVDTDFILLTLEELEKSELLINSGEFTSDKVSRRKVITKYGLAALMLPIVATIVAPKAVQAASGTCVADPTLSCITVPDCAPFDTPCGGGCTCFPFSCIDNCCSRNVIC